MASSFSPLGHGLDWIIICVIVDVRFMSAGWVQSTAIRPSSQELITAEGSPINTGKHGLNTVESKSQTISLPRVCYVKKTLLLMLKSTRCVILILLILLKVK